jgi:type IV secretion system protein VirB3
MSLRRTPIHRALHRPKLLLGAERTPVLMLGLGTLGVAFIALNFVAFVVGGLSWVVCLGLLRRAAKADPDMSRVFFRQMKYRGYYEARSTHWRTDPK